MELHVLVKLPRRIGSDPIDFLLRLKFPDLPLMQEGIDILLRQKFPDLPLLQEGHARPSKPGSAARLRDTEEAAVRYYEELKALPAEEIKRRIDEAEASYRKELEAKRAAEEANFWFNKATVRPDYHRWAVMPYWTLEEAIALSLDREPDRVKLRSLQPFMQVSKFAELFAYRLKLAQRAKALEKLFDPVLPPFFVRWAQTYGVILPIELIDSVEAAHGVHRNWEDEAKRLSGALSELQGKLETALADNASLRADMESKPIPLDERERTSLLKLVAGMAVGGYGFDPKAARSPATKEIADDLQRNGIALDEDTVRKYLQLAKAIIEEHQTE